MSGWRGRLRRAFGFSDEVVADITIVGGRTELWDELYHHHLRASWWVSLGAITAMFLAVNALFAVAFLAVGGVENLPPGSFPDAFFFSVHTMATIGYGSMYPVGRAAHLLVVAESIVGLLVTALATGLVFAKFTVPAARIRFSQVAVVSPIDGVPTLTIRVGNSRGNAVVDANFHLSMTRTAITREGRLFYRFVELPLTRTRATSLQRSWNLFHPIDAASPLHGLDPKALADHEIELLVSLAGTDDTTFQPVFARKRYDTPDIRFGWRLADVLVPRADGHLELHLERFDEIEPCERTPEFPYPEG